MNAPLFSPLQIRQLVQVYNSLVHPEKRIRVFKDRKVAIARVHKALGREATEEELSGMFEKLEPDTQVCTGVKADDPNLGAEESGPKELQELLNYPMPEPVAKPKRTRRAKPEPDPSNAGPWADEHDGETPSERAKRLANDPNHNDEETEDMATATKTKTKKVKAARKVRAPKAKKEGTRAYNIIPLDTKIRVLAKECPYRKGSEGAKRWAKLMDVPAASRTYQTMRNVKLGGGHIGHLLEIKAVEKA